MKLLFGALLYLFTLTSAHAQAWSRNPTTGKVEFKGVPGIVFLKYATPWAANRTAIAQGAPACAVPWFVGASRG